MEKIIYTIAMGETSGIIKAVNDKINDGYEPFGSAFAVQVNPDKTHIMQPMVKKQLDITPPKFR